MLKKLFTKRLMLVAFAAICLSSCNDKDDTKPSLRAKVDYSKFTATTPYDSLFVDSQGVSTVDLSAGNARYKMFQALNSYLGSAVRETKQLDANVMKNMFSNTGSPFTGDFAALNTAGVQLRNVTASSRTDAETVRGYVEQGFTQMAAASTQVGATASKGVAGKLGTYLVDAKGIEIAQIIQKSLIGALQLDYIGNVLLDKGLQADNFSLVSDKKYTQLEQNWDQAYGFLTLNRVYLANSTDATRGTTEMFLGAYVWEYNKSGYPKMHQAFLKGRAAIVNNDQNELKAQATLIRIEMEKAIANAALGYLGKWKTGATDAARAHAIGEGIGFIYSLRFCNINGVDAAFSDGLIMNLVGSTGGFWDLTSDKINAASEAITAKFKL